MAADAMNEERFVLRNARHLAADYMIRTLREGDIAIDATMGNGHDTQFLCGLVGACGHVYAFDVQQSAIDNTHARLEAADMSERATLILDGHQNMANHVKETVRAVMFNLGWLPGAAHAVTTKVETTLQAVNAAAQLLVPGGVMTICVYPGHEEGSRELAALLEWAGALNVRTYNVLHHHFICAAPGTPRLILVQKNL
ncbi:MAG: class I SAM-dependent methyltransferase [Clostridia bacterium]|nr:class I SAM-dependent methyltransferase [Clostridia bacterium]